MKLLHIAKHGAQAQQEEPKPKPASWAQQKSFETFTVGCTVDTSQEGSKDPTVFKKHLSLTKLETTITKQQPTTKTTINQRPKKKTNHKNADRTKLAN